MVIRWLIEQHEKNQSCASFLILFLFWFPTYSVGDQQRLMKEKRGEIPFFFSLNLVKGFLIAHSVKIPFWWKPGPILTYVTGQSSWCSLPACVEHTKKRLQLLHWDKIYFGRAQNPRVIPYLPRWNQFASAECWREIVFNTCKQQHSDKVLCFLSSKVTYVN